MIADARALAEQVPNTNIRAAVLYTLDEIEPANAIDARRAYEAARPLHYFAVREFCELEGVTGPPAELGKLISKLCYELWLAAGSPRDA